MKSFPERLKDAREHAGLSQADLAARIGVSAGSVGNWEAGSRGMPRSILALARELKVRPEWLKDGKLPREAGTTVPCSDIAEALNLMASQLSAAPDLPVDVIKASLSMLVDGRADPERVGKAIRLIQEALGADLGNSAGRQTTPLQYRAG